MSEFIKEWKEMQQKCHDLAKDKGFWDHEFNCGEKIALIHSEISEALEAYRDNLMDDKLPEYSGLTVELADAVIRIMDLAGRMQLPIAEALVEKLEYNKTRPHKHGKKF